MTKLKIIAKLWAVIYDLLFYIEGREGKTLEQIHDELDLIEMYCRPYADCDDVELDEMRRTRGTNGRAEDKGGDGGETQSEYS